MNPAPPQTPAQVIYIVVLTLAAVVLIGLGALCVTAFFKITVDPSILNTISNLTNVAFGAIAGVLANTRQSQQNDPPAQLREGKTE